MTEIIREKQQGQSHSPQTIQSLVQNYTVGKISDYQMTAWLMAVYFQGMSSAETFAYTQAMLDSGSRMDLSDLPGYVVDKHSTGGVGDKISLILGPLLASCGCYVPMLSGRGLGHTGGTLDKLESIPGYRVDLPLDRFRAIVEEVGISMIGQTAEICPADRLIYALRDVTATVASLPLICGSIMSKKIAEGLQGLVLDVKCGSGAFMTSLDDARELAKLLSQVGQNHGLQMAYSITDMNQPLGRMSGIYCEVQESLAVLAGGGPTDIRELTLQLGAQALQLSGIKDNPRQLLIAALDGGKAMETFQKMVAAQDGDATALENPDLHAPSAEIVLKSPRAGYLVELNTAQLGMGIIAIGGGRRTKDDIIDPTAGLEMLCSLGDEVKEGGDLIRLFCAKSNLLDDGIAQISDAIIIRDEAPTLNPLIIETNLQA